jgi:plasmid maintenance system antidote protein VapI
MKKKSFINVHPGISESNLSEIIHGKRSITVSISLRLGKFFELNPSFFGLVCKMITT